jgi:SOS-response transcriptional repressor LexA
MYLPYARNRYGEGAFIGSREELKGSFDNGELILVKKQNEYIAGQIVVYQGDEATMPTLGVLDGRWEFVAEGALAASY